MVIVEDVTENPFLDIRLSPVFIHVIVSAPSTKRSRSRNEKKWQSEYCEVLKIKMIWDFLYQGENIQKSRPLKKNAKQIYLQVTSEGVALICCFFVKISQIFSCRTFFCYHNKKYLSELTCQINISNVYLEGYFERIELNLGGNNNRIWVSQLFPFQ